MICKFYFFKETNGIALFIATMFKSSFISTFCPYTGNVLIIIFNKHSSFKWAVLFNMKYEHKILVTHLLFMTCTEGAVTCKRLICHFCLERSQFCHLKSELFSSLMLNYSHFRLTYISFSVIFVWLLTVLQCKMSHHGAKSVQHILLEKLSLNCTFQVSTSWKAETYRKLCHDVFQPRCHYCSIYRVIKPKLLYFIKL